MFTPQAKWEGCSRGVFYWTRDRGAGMPDFCSAPFQREQHPRLRNSQSRFRSDTRRFHCYPFPHSICRHKLVVQFVPYSGYPTLPTNTSRNACTPLARQRKVTVATPKFCPVDDTPLVEYEPRSMVYGADEAHRPHANRWPPSESKSHLYDASDWAADFSGDGGLATLAGSLYLVTNF